MLLISRFVVFFFFKQKTAYEMRISDWSSDVCSSDLFKPGRLEEAELRLMKRHSSSGHELLSGLGHPWLDCAAEVALYHHERHDGGGYPRGLAGADTIGRASGRERVCQYV